MSFKIEYAVIFIEYKTYLPRFAQMGKAQLSFGAQLYSGVSNKVITFGTRRSGFRRLKLGLNVEALAVLCV